jgi:cyclophilin family peptidyl-prolyl cis-trans isomerase/HEAT repeat protein
MMYTACSRFSFLLFAFFFTLISALFGQPFWQNGEMRAIKVAADRRDAVALQSYLDKSDALDAFVLYNLASVQSEQALPDILRKLASPSARVREQAAFALGQTLRLSPRASQFEDSVLTFIVQERNRAVRYELILALGYFGSLSALEKLVDLNLKDRVLQDAVAEAIARAAIRQVRSEKLTAAAALLYEKTQRAPMFNFSVYALARIADSALLSAHQSVIFSACRAPHPETRTYAITAASFLRNSQALSLLIDATRDKDWRVAVNAIRALSRFFPDNPTPIYDAALQLLHAPQYHLQKETLLMLARRRALQDAGSMRDTLITAIEQLLYSSSTDLKAEALRALAAIMPERAASHLAQMISQRVLTPAALDAMGILMVTEKRLRPDLLSTLQTYATDPQPLHATAAIRALGTIWKTFHSNRALNLSIDSSLVLALAHHTRSTPQNTSAIQTIASIFSDSMLASPKFSAPLQAALAQLSSHRDAETVMTLLDALATLRDSTALPTVEKYLTDEELSVRKKAAEVYMRLSARPVSISMTLPASTPDWTFFQRFSKNPRAIIETSKGRISLELFIEEAPFSVQNFITLAEQHFFDGLTFHRVVSNFVVQGGDPKGDGSGGPPYSIRSEFTRRRFERGIIGMASAGKDTEGSQFFIMHSHHPHLDGRYTAFGLVKAGLEVLDKLEVGDKILSIKIQ